jgi:hypothetical protein
MCGGWNSGRLAWALGNTVPGLAEHRFDLLSKWIGLISMCRPGPLRQLSILATRGGLGVTSAGFGLCSRLLFGLTHLSQHPKEQEQ